MIFILFKKITATVLACLLTTVSAAGYFENGSSADINEENVSQGLVFNSIEADAANLATPVLKVVSTTSDKIYVQVANLNKYNSKTTFNLYVDNNLIRKNITFNDIKKDNGNISFVHNGKEYLKHSTNYYVKLRAYNNKLSSNITSPLKATTKNVTYFYVKPNSQIYKLSGSKMVKSSISKSALSVAGWFTNDKGVLITGKDPHKYSGTFIRITSGAYKNQYIKVSDQKSFRISEESCMRNIVVDYAASMDGGRYVYGGSSYRATDCSGLVMLSYKKIGVSLPHSARQMRYEGESVSKSNMAPGDIIVMNGGSHVGMYIGNNKIVHAMNSRDGIQVQSASNLKYYTVNTVRRII